MKGMYTSLIERERSAESVDTAFRRYARFTGKRWRELLKPELREGETMPDVELLQLLMQRALARRCRRMSEAGEALLDERQDAAEQQKAAAAEAGRTRTYVRDLRTTLQGRFGRERTSDFLGLRGATRRDPVDLQRQADRAVRRLRDEQKALPAAGLGAKELDRESYAAPLADHAAALRQARVRVTAAGKRVDYALVIKDRALEDYNDVFFKVTTWFEALYRLIGFEAAAREVRPSGHRKGRTFLDVQRRRKKPRKKAAGKTAGGDTTGDTATDASPAENPTEESPAAPAALEAIPAEIVPARVGPAVIEVAAVESRPARLLPFEPLRRALSIFRRSG